MPVIDGYNTEPSWQYDQWIAGRMQMSGKAVYCDDENGDDDADGYSWATAKATVQAAVNLARYPEGESALDYTDKSGHRFVFIAPGHYNGTDSGGILRAGMYNVHIIGCGPAVPGKDYGVSFNYDGLCDDDNPPVIIQGSGNSLENIHVYHAADDAAVWLGNPANGGDNNLIQNCVIECDGTNATYGILCEGMKGSWIKNCVISGAATACISIAGGADHYAIDGGIVDCVLSSSVTGAKGIYVTSQATLVASRVFQIARNLVNVVGGGATSKGIDNDNTGYVVIHDNRVLAHTTCIEDAADLQMHNVVNASGTVTDPSPANGA